MRLWFSIEKDLLIDWDLIVIRGMYECDEMEQFFEGQTGEDEKQFEELVVDCRNCCSDQATSKKSLIH